MAHFAQIDSENIVVQVIVGTDGVTEAQVSEQTGETWLQTSYNTFGGVHYDPTTGEPSADQSKALRKNYAGIGFTYDSQRDAFIPPKDYYSWVLNETTCLWEPPVPCPTGDGIDPETGRYYVWDEMRRNWTVEPSWEA